MEKEKFIVDIEKLQNLTFPQEYASFNQLCYDIVLFNGEQCTEKQRDKLKTKSVREHIKRQLKDFEYECYTPVGKRNEHQVIHGLKDVFREVMNTELEEGQNAKYNDYLIPLLKHTINSLGTGKHVILLKNIISELGFMQEGYSVLSEDTQNKGYASRVVRKLNNNIQVTVENHMKSLSKANLKGITITKTGTLQKRAMNKKYTAIYEQIYEEEKQKIRDYRKLPYLVNLSFNNYFTSFDQSWEPQDFYRNWIIDIQPDFQPFSIKDDLDDCRKELNKNFILKLKKDVGYTALMNFKESSAYTQVRNQIDYETKFYEIHEENPKIINGYFIPQELKKYLIEYGDERMAIYYDIYNLGSYLYDISTIIKFSLIL